MIKDAYTWMGSLCRHRYSALWFHTEKHCPNLIANSYDNKPSGQIIPFTIGYSKMTYKYMSMVQAWNNWYKDVLQTSFPRLIIRFEDLLFRTEETTRKVCECAGGKFYDKPFKYVEDSAKGPQRAHVGANGRLS